jgi:TIR domain
LSGKVFINYRRDDDPGNAGRLYDRLEAEFGASQLFMDVEGNIKGGDDFVDVLRTQVAGCDVLLAIIGRRWLLVADEAGRRRLDNPEDWVRVEIVGALETGKRVIPVLVGGATIPSADDLPDPIKPLTRKQVARPSVSPPSGLPLCCGPASTALTRSPCGPSSTSSPRRARLARRRQRLMQSRRARPASLRRGGGAPRRPPRRQRPSGGSRTRLI